MGTVVNWGVLGAAAIAVERTMPGMQQAPSVNLLAIASRASAKAEAVAAQFGIPRAYGSYEDLLADPDIDAVYVPLPNQLHVPWATQAMEAGKHVLCEKPLSTTIDGVNELIAVRDRTGRHIEEALSYRNHPQWQTVADLLTAGTIGDIKSVHAVMAKRFPDPTDIRNNPDVGGGSLYDMGPYVISACNLFYQGPPIRVVGALETHPEFGVDGLSSALLDYGGRHACITVSIHNGPTGWGSHQQLTALGTNGWLRLTFPFAHGRPTPCRVEIGDTTSAGAYPTSTQEFPPLDQYQLQTERFSRFVLGHQVPSWPLEDARDIARTINALFASAGDGTWRSLAE